MLCCYFLCTGDVISSLPHVSLCRYLVLSIIFIDYFVRGTVKKGILPEILEELLAARARAKDDLKRRQTHLFVPCWTVDSWP